MSEGQSIVYTHTASMVFDHCTHQEKNPLIHIRNITTNIQHLWNNVHKCYILAQSQGMFICTKFLLWLVTVPIWIKSTYSFLYCNKHKMWKKYANITQICHSAKWYLTYISNRWYLITVLNQSILLWDITTKCKKKWP